ncbi:hypothetical protein VTK26DRAFT_7674 [Humicola hyalothermophila]
MDGSYGNVLPTSKAMSSGMASTSSSDRYKINVNRQKTKKWANFKPQNYDGDDWGADYNDPSDEPEPHLSPKPLGPRYPAAHSPTTRTFRGDEPALLPSQTQRPGQTERRATEPIASPQPKPPGTAGSNKPASRPALSPFPKPSPTPPMSPGSPRWHPLQKSSTGGREAAGATRPAFSPNAASPSSSNKPLPSVPPDGIDDRRPPEPTISSPHDALGLGGNPQKQDQGRHADATGIGEISQTPGPAAGLPTVAERKSEYGIESLLDSYGPEQLTEANLPEPPKSAPPVSHDIPRRFSTSPQLPDVSRLSGFGEDLFSSTSFFRNSILQPPIQESTETTSAPGQPVPAPSESVVAREASIKSPATADAAMSMNSGSAQDAEAPQRASSANADVDAAAPPPNEPDRLTEQSSAGGGSSVTQPAVNDAEQQQSAANPHQVAPCDTKQPATIPARPSLPGGLVTETATPAEPAASPSPSPSQGESNNVAEPQGPPLGAVADAQAEVSPPTAGEPEVGLEEANMNRASVDQKTSPPVQPPSPRALPPLRTSGSALSTKLEMPSQQSVTKPQSGDASPPGISGPESSSPKPPSSVTTQHSEITPTAPLNPRRTSLDPDVKSDIEPIVAPLAFGTRSASDTPNDSPIKDSDVLSEEIIKSLGPIPSSGDLGGASEASTATYRAAAAAAEATRESSYLGDVYGDYWASAQEEPLPLPSLKTGDPEKTSQAPSTLAAESSTTGLNSVPSGTAVGASAGSIKTAVEAPDAKRGSSGGTEGLRRFSWEGPPSPKEPAVEEKALVSESTDPPPGAAELEAPANVPLPLSPNGEDLKVDSRGDSASELVEALTAKIPLDTSQQAEPLSQLSLDRTINTPSPLSTLSERRNASPRLSLSEEKIPLQESGTPAAPSVPLEKQPALPDAHQQTSVRDPLPKKETVNIPAFRSIMELPSAAERIKQYNTARIHVSEVETGLRQWLEEMMARHPEHASAAFAPPAVAAPHSQQQGSHGGLAAHVPHVLGQASAGFAHSSNQMGTKSKELLMAAGKAGKGFGKGLLNKGRSKLRGTG